MVPDLMLLYFTRLIYIQSFPRYSNVNLVFETRVNFSCVINIKQKFACFFLIHWRFLHDVIRLCPWHWVVSAVCISESAVTAWRIHLKISKSSLYQMYQYQFSNIMCFFFFCCTMGISLKTFIRSYSDVTLLAQYNIISSNLESTNYRK